MLFLASHLNFYFLSSTSTRHWPWGFQYFFFGNMEWVEFLQLLQLTFDWSRYLDSGRPGSPGSSQSEPSQAQNSPSNIASPIIFFCSNCGEDLQQAVFGRTLQYQRFGNEVECCCCGQNRQYGRYVSIPNNIYFWLCLLRGRFMESGSEELSQHAICPGALKSHIKIYKRSRLTKGCTFPYLIVMCVTNICIFGYIVTDWTMLLLNNFAAFRKCLCWSPRASVDCHGKGHQSIISNSII